MLALGKKPLLEKKEKYIDIKVSEGNITYLSRNASLIIREKPKTILE